MESVHPDFTNCSTVWTDGWMIPASLRLSSMEIFGVATLSQTKREDPWLIDPAVYFGHREVDLAFTELFGGFPSSFYAAYQEAFPLSEDYDNRKPLYQLYYLLVHLNLFGEAYGLRVDQILKRYVG